MIKFHLHTDGERAPALAKLLVDEKKEPEWLFFDVKGTKQGVSEVSGRAIETTMRLPCRPRYDRTSLGV